MWVTNTLGAVLPPLAWPCADGSVLHGFQLPLHVGQPARIDPHSLHALPTLLPHEAGLGHVLLVGFSVPWLHRATPPQVELLLSLGFRLGLSRGGVGPDEGSNVGLDEGSNATSDGREVYEKSEETAKVLATVGRQEDVRDNSPGLLESCLIAEGHWQLNDLSANRRVEANDLQQDVQEDTAGEGSTNFRGAYARRLETRNFEPSEWDQVKQYLVGLGLKHLIGQIDALGVDSLEDFGFLYREDLMEAGATKDEAETILSCTGAATEGRPEPPPLARSGYNRPSRPAAPLRIAEAARIVRVPDRADRVRHMPGPSQGVQGATTGSLGIQDAAARSQGVQGATTGSIGIQDAAARSQGVQGATTGSIGIQDAAARSQGVQGATTGSIGVQDAAARSQGVQGATTGSLGIQDAAARSQGVQGATTGSLGIQDAAARSLSRRAASYLPLHP